MNDKEFESVLALPAARRYAHFINRVADTEELWSLRDDNGWAVVADDEGHQAIPVWPHARYAEACARGEWDANVAESIALDVWMEKWLPGMERDGLMVAVFPSPENHGVIVPPDRLRADLEEELAKIE